MTRDTRNNAPTTRPLVVVLLEQAFEESRYHRRFHHTIFSLSTTLYGGLLLLQVAYAGAVRDLDGFIAAILAVALFAGIPYYVCWTIINYHKTIAELNAVINVLSGRLMRESNIKLSALGVDKQAAAHFLFEKYGDAVRRKMDLYAVGRGHKGFLLVFVGVWFMNLLVAGRMALARLEGGG